jgi:hypothetical protein
LVPPPIASAVISEQALHHEMMSLADVEEIRLRMERVEVNRLQPHYFQAFFDEAFGRLGGRTTQREPGRYEIRNVPVPIRDRDIGVGAPVVKSHERVTFESDKVRVPNAPPAPLVCPGRQRGAPARVHAAVLSRRADSCQGVSRPLGVRTSASNGPRCDANCASVNGQARNQARMITPRATRRAH